METTPNLTSLPLEVLTQLSFYLSPHDILSLSAACRFLRYTFNSDWIWKRFANNCVGLGLISAKSLVKPVFKNPQQIDTLEPLCLNRLYFLMQSRLLNNLSQNKFVKHTIDFDGFICDLETTKSPNGNQITYKDIYLFVLDYFSPTSTDEAIKVFNIEENPILIKTLKLLSHEEYSVKVGYEVVEDKLVIYKDNWLDVYQIHEPIFNIEHFYSININDETGLLEHKCFSSSNYLVCVNSHLDIKPVYLWNIVSGEKSVFNPKPDYQTNSLTEFVSEDRKQILFTSSSIDKCFFNFFVFDIGLLKFSYFSIPEASLLFLKGQLSDFFSLVNNKYAIFSSKNNVCYITVFDHITSVIKVQNEFNDNCKIEYAKMIKNEYLMVPFLLNILILSISNLETVWNLEIDCGGITYEIPANPIYCVDYINVSDFHHFIIIHKFEGLEVWDFVKKNKILSLATNCNVGVNETGTKLIFCGNGTLDVASFW